jgi:N-methylhydantoinase A
VYVDGNVHTPIEVEDITSARTIFENEGVDSVAIVFLHSYANPAHELAAREAICAAGFEGAVSLSHEVSGEYREYERTTTTVIDAYVRPRMVNYLSVLEEQLSELGFAGAALVTRSGGGAMSFREAEARPFETVLSGPVAGAEGAAELARALELGDVITADVGGTSFDTCLITLGRPQMMYEGEIVGLPVQTPWVDVRSIGAGGGSIGYIDVGGLLRVGPQSAGADPGPACYSRGGAQPTVTDAALVLGMLGEGVLASGILLDREAATAAMAPLSAQLSLAIDEIARGVVTIAAANMANAIREITVERGQDPRRATLMAFGGAGPLFATLLARELDITGIVVPAHAGNFSAWGLLGADLTQGAALTRITPLHEDSLDDLTQTVRTVLARLAAPESSTSEAESTHEAAFDMRYVGQEHTLTVEVPLHNGGISTTISQIRASFTENYERIFGHVMDEDVEVVSTRATLRTPLPRRMANTSLFSHDANSTTTEFTCYSFARGEYLEFAVVPRRGLAQSTIVAGPAILIEDTATTYLDDGFTATVAQFDALLIRKA